MEHESKIAITGNDVHFFSNLQISFRIECDRGVFGGKTDDSAVWIISEDWRSFVLADRLLADVEDRAIGSRAADDGGQNGDRGPMAGDVAGLGVILAGEDAAAGLDFGDPGDVGGVLVGAGAAGRDDPAFRVRRPRRGREPASSLPIAAAMAARFSAGSAIIRV